MTKKKNVNNPSSKITAGNPQSDQGKKNEGKDKDKQSEQRIGGKSPKNMHNKQGPETVEARSTIIDKKDEVKNSNTQSLTNIGDKKLQKQMLLLKKEEEELKERNKKIQENSEKKTGKIKKTNAAKKNSINTEKERIFEDQPMPLKDKLKRGESFESNVKHTEKHQKLCPESTITHGHSNWNLRETNKQKCVADPSCSRYEAGEGDSYRSSEKINKNYTDQQKYSKGEQTNYDTNVPSMKQSGNKYHSYDNYTKEDNERKSNNTYGRKRNNTSQISLRKSEQTSKTEDDNVYSIDSWNNQPSSSNWQQNDWSSGAQEKGKQQSADYFAHDKPENKQFWRINDSLKGKNNIKKTDFEKFDSNRVQPNRNKGGNKSKNKSEQYDKAFAAFNELLKNSMINYGRVEEKMGDLFSAPPEYSLGHCVAEDMLMGAGIAVQFRSMFRKTGELLNQEVKTGGVAVLQDKERFIYYLVTKARSSGKPTLYTLWLSLHELKKHMIAHNITKLAIPQIGCGLDRLYWDDVKQMLEYIFKEVPIEIVVYSLHQVLERKPGGHININITESMSTSKSEVIEKVHKRHKKGKTKIMENQHKKGKHPNKRSKY